METITPNTRELRDLFPEDELAAVGDVPRPIRRLLVELEERVAADATVCLARDWEGLVVGIVEGDDNLESLAFTDDGHVGHGGVNQPHYVRSFAELCA